MWPFDYFARLLGWKTKPDLIPCGHKFHKDTKTPKTDGLV